MTQSPTIQKLTEALVKAQAEMKNPAFDAFNPHFKSKYASLPTVREAVLPVLNKHGLALSQFPRAEGTYAGCTNLLLHVSGEWVQSDCLLPIDKVSSQGAGSAITYARRFSMQSIAGVVGEEDTDGGGDQGNNGKKLEEKAITDFLTTINDASTVSELQAAYVKAYKEADDIQDKAAQDRFIKAKDTKKKALEKK
jgi:hypothetical protein